MTLAMKSRALISSLLLAVALVLMSAAPASATANQVYRWRLFNVINDARAAHGLHRFHIADSLRSAAQHHSLDMVSRDYFAHTSPTGSTFYHRVLESGFPSGGSWSAGENLAWGTRGIGSPRSVVRMWLHSPAHRANLLSNSFGCIGIGRATGRFLGHGGAIVWTADFGHR
jgi:uncharacterized protein YkwD